MEPRHGVEADAPPVAHAGTAGTRERDVHGLGAGGAQFPEGGSRPMAEQRTLSHREEGRRLRGERGERAMADHVDATMERVQAPRRDAVPDRRIRQAELDELPVGQDAVLAPGQLCDPPISRHGCSKDGRDPCSPPRRNDKVGLGRSRSA